MEEKIKEPNVIETVRGLVRPAIAFGFMLILVVGFFQGKVEWDSISQLVAAVVAFYYAERAALKQPGNGA